MTSPQHLERILQVSMATFVALGTVLLGIGQDSMVWPIAAIFVSASSLYLTDIKRWLVINNALSNVAAWIALGISVWHLNGLADVDSLQAMSELLVYLQFILLFKQKSVRHYWLLTVSSLLQVSVGAALSVTVTFGAVLIVYTFVGLFAMTVFYLYRESQPLVATGKPKAAAAKQSLRWPLAGQVATVDAPPRAAVGLGWDLYRRVFSTGVATLVLATLVFLFVPRVDRASWRMGGGEGPRHVVGFSPEVKLGEFGEITESPSRVMRIRFTNPETGLPYVLDEPPLLRGVTLTQYDKGGWSREVREEKLGALPLLLERPEDMPLVKQQIEIEPLDTDILFCVHPPVAMIGDRDAMNVLYSPRRENIRRPRGMRDREFQFEIQTYGLRDGKQVAVIPARHRLDADQRAELIELPRKDGELTVPELAATAAEIVADIPADNPEARARALERYLRRSDRFHYSLQGQPRDPALDPIEDFVTNHPSGHCEYFASALALMLRSVGIPARMVIGFRAGTLNMSTHWYEVQQLHAHTWVEAYLDPTSSDATQLPSAAGNGAWMTLDPTPGVNDDAEDEASYSTYLRMMRDWAQTAWSEYVVGMDADRQRDAVYKPLAATLSKIVQGLADRGSTVLQRVRGLLGWFRPQALLEGDFTGPKLFVAVVMVSLVAAVLWMVVIVLRRLGGWRRRDRRETAERSTIEFYRRLETVLARQRWTRSRTQTQREFATSAGGQLSETALTAPLAAIPRRVVDAFYRVRFGRRPLDNHELQAVEEALAQLEAGLSR